ncbi:MAG: cytochrome c [Candidatus Kapabacteria bacterium]|nr:cytochrome c [Candidatus Kapabacteria bacterium]
MTSSPLRSLLVIAAIVGIGTVVTGCNIDGFFTSYGDDPVWVDPNAKAAAATASADAGGPGKAIYGRICAACHLGTGKGVPGNNIPPLAGSELAQGDVTKPIAIILHGFRGPIVRNGVNINGQMAPWQDQLDDQEIADVLTYVRSNFGNGAGPVTADEVKAVREQTASRTQPYTEAELP